MPKINIFVSRLESFYLFYHDLLNACYIHKFFSVLLVHCTFCTVPVVTFFQILTITSMQKVIICCVLRSIWEVFVLFLSVFIILIWFIIGEFICLVVSVMRRQWQVKFQPAWIIVGTGLLLHYHWWISYTIITCEFVAF